eukprot:1437916-Rhodomonas_salina.1
MTTTLQAPSGRFEISVATCSAPPDLSSTAAARTPSVSPSLGSGATSDVESFVGNRRQVSDDRHRMWRVS